MLRKTLLTLSVSVMLGIAISAPSGAHAQLFGPPPGGPPPGGPPSGLGLAGPPPMGGLGGPPMKGLPHPPTGGQDIATHGPLGSGNVVGSGNVAINRGGNVYAGTHYGGGYEHYGRGYWGSYAAGVATGAAASGYSRSYTYADGGCYYVTRYKRDSYRRVLVCPEY